MIGIIKVAGVADTLSSAADTAGGVISSIADTVGAATTGQKIGYGAGGGATIGALATLFQKNPSLMKALRNAMTGAGVGAAAGGGIAVAQNYKDDSPGEVLDDVVDRGKSGVDSVIAKSKGAWEGAKSQLKLA